MGLVILAAAGLAVWQWDNVKPYLLSKLHDSETLSESLEKKREENAKQLADQGVEVPNLTKEQMDELIRGETTAEQAVQKLNLDRYQSDQTVDDIVNHCVAELYQYESQLYGQLGALRQSTISAWKSLPASERTFAEKQRRKAAAVQQCYAMEVSADNNVSAILARYHDLVAQQGGDPSRIDSLWSIYCSEKASVKAYYLSLE